MIVGTTTDEARMEAYADILRALLLRNGGRLTVTPEEVTEDDFSLMWRRMENGGIEIRLADTSERGN